MNSAYVKLGLQSLFGGVVMYLVMFTMIDSLGSFYNNLNMLYMTLMMVAPMVAAMVIAMRDMFPRPALNAALIAASIVVFLGGFALIRTQTTIDDTAFLRSMIPHHSGAILMCREAKLTNPKIIELCKEIIASQRSEIEQMQRILAASR